MTFISGKNTIISSLKNHQDALSNCAQILRYEKGPRKQAYIQKHLFRGRTLEILEKPAGGNFIVKNWHRSLYHLKKAWMGLLTWVHLASKANHSRLRAFELDSHRRLGQIRAKEPLFETIQKQFNNHYNVPFDEFSPTSVMRQLKLCKTVFHNLSIETYVKKQKEDGVFDNVKTTYYLRKHLFSKTVTMECLVRKEGCLNRALYKIKRLWVAFLEKAHFAETSKAKIAEQRVKDKAALNHLTDDPNIRRLYSFLNHPAPPASTNRKQIVKSINKFKHDIYNDTKLEVMEELHARGIQTTPYLRKHIFGKTTIELLYKKSNSKWQRLIFSLKKIGLRLLKKCHLATTNRENLEKFTDRIDLRLKNLDAPYLKDLCKNFKTNNGTPNPLKKLNRKTTLRSFNANAGLIGDYAIDKYAVDLENHQYGYRLYTSKSLRGKISLKLLKKPIKGSILSESFYKFFYRLKLMKLWLFSKIGLVNLNTNAIANYRNTIPKKIHELGFQDASRLFWIIHHVKTK